ncbi:flagellar assembly peptidoglycan hydrolase FlgJ, partial [Stenotrophomonas maltophilia]
MVAQAALETGWASATVKHADGSTSHNLFGIKANGWNGQHGATAGTHEYVDGVRRNETASFRAYSSPAESFAD